MTFSWKWILFFTVSFLLMSFSSVVNVDTFRFLRYSIYGISSNFSIFISQFIAIIFFQHFIRRKNFETLDKKYFLVLTLSIFPLLVWQVSSDGRAGIILTILVISAFFYVERGMIAGIAGLFIALGAMFIIEHLLSLYYQNIHYLLLGVENISTKPFTNVHGGLLRGQGTIKDLLLRDIDSSNLVFILIDKFSSGRLSGLIETFQNITLQIFLFGAGVGKYKILDNIHYPHVELLRHLVELGILGFFITLAIYAKPFTVAIPSPFHRFAKLYLLAFLTTTLVQPSGPLIHLNSGFLFWIAYGELMRENAPKTAIRD